MKLFLFILAVVLWVGARSRAAAAKHVADPENTSDTESASSPFKKSAFESLFDEFKGVVDNFDEPESVVEPEEDPISPESGSTESFLRYEAVVGAQPQATETVVENFAKSEDNQSFDLRQAVIYQTILSNKYLDEIRSHDN